MCCAPVIEEDPPQELGDQGDYVFHRWNYDEFHEVYVIYPHFGGCIENHSRISN